MRRGSFQGRLPRGRLSRKGSPALLRVAMFLAVIAASLFYLFPGSPHLSSSPSSSSDLLSPLDIKSVPLKSGQSLDSYQEESLLPPMEKKEIDSNDLQPNAASKHASLTASVQLDSKVSEVHLENTGSLPLHQIQITSQGRSLGKISMLDRQEKKVLAVSGPPQDIAVQALDPDDHLLSAQVKYESLPEAGSTRSTEDPTTESMPLKTKSVPSSSISHSSELYTAPSSSGNFPSVTSIPVAEEDLSQNTPLLLNLAVNRSDGRPGEAVGYRCIARNGGQIELSDVAINCAGKVASTSYLTPGKELHLDGFIIISNDTRLQAEVQASDPEGDILTRNASAEIRRICSELDLKLVYPQRAHRGDEIKLAVRVENKGIENLTNILVRCGEGEIGRIELLPSGSSQTLEKKMIVDQSMQDLISAEAKSPVGQDVYASQRLNLSLLNSSLQIQGSPEEVRIYPGEPAEVFWHLKNSGEETLYNITLVGDGDSRILRELAPGKSVDVAAIYSNNLTTWINVTARGFNGNGFEASDSAGVLLQAIRPGITIKAMPTEVEACPGEEGKANILVSNSGDDVLDNVLLRLNGSAIATIGKLLPGEFRVIQSKTTIIGNCSLEFEALGEDSVNKIQSDAATVKVNCVRLSLKVFASASPAVVSPGESCEITCIVANTGKVTLNDIFVISKRLGPLGHIDCLYPKRQMTVTTNKSVSSAIEDTITAEGFTQERTSVRASTTLSIELVSSSPSLEDSFQAEEPGPGRSSATDMTWANITLGNISQPFNLPAQEEMERDVSRQMARNSDRSAMKQNNAVMDGISNLLRYVERLLGAKEAEASPAIDRPQSEALNPDSEPGFAPQSRDELAASQNYELSIAGVKGSEHGAIVILDVNAQPSQPAANEPIKVTAHLKSPEGIENALVKYGLSDLPLTRSDMLNVARVYDCALSLESGTVQDGYWSGSIPGRGAGTYMPLSLWITDGTSTAEGGPYLIHWSTVNAAERNSKEAAKSSGKGMLFIESTSVKGRGEVSIKDTVMGSNVQFDEKLKGSGSISLESLRVIDRKGAEDNFTEKKDLVFTGGQLKGRKTVASPKFQGGLGASVTERFNLSHVDKSETSRVTSNSLSNNSLSFQTDQAFDGTWNIQTKYAKFFKKMKADQKYTGSFQTQKDIEFQDNAPG